MTRNGIGTLIRNGPAPGRAGISHLARNEMVVPNAAMQRDPSLRRHAMMSMARMGRDPAQYVVGSGRNSRNPRTGAAEYADMYYDPNAGGWVSGTGAPIDFSASQDSYANTGTVDPNAWQAPAPGTAKTYNGGASPFGPSEPPAYVQPEAGTPRYYPSAPAPTVPEPGTPKFYPSATMEQTTTQPTLAEVQAPQQQVQQQTQDFSPWNAPQTYDQWRDTRNPAGKNVQNTLFGQTTGAGYSLPSTPLTMGADQYAGQMPVGNPVPWSIPGTALGFGAENTGTDPSILNNGYQSNINSAAGYGSFMPNALAGLFGGGNQNGGIAFSGASGQPYGQPYGGTGAGDFRAPFRY